MKGCGLTRQGWKGASHRSPRVVEFSCVWTTDLGAWAACLRYRAPEHTRSVNVQSLPAGNFSIEPGCLPASRHTGGAPSALRKGKWGGNEKNSDPQINARNRSFTTTGSVGVQACEEGGCFQNNKRIRHRTNKLETDGKKRKISSSDTNFIHDDLRSS